MRKVVDNGYDNEQACRGRKCRLTVTSSLSTMDFFLNKRMTRLTYRRIAFINDGICRYIEE